MFTDVMIDLETMSSRPNAAIAAIGAVAFDMKTLTLGETFYTTIDLESCEKLGLHFSASTVSWWLKQSEQARRDVLGGKQTDLSLALADFSSWLCEHCVPAKSLKIWGNGGNFDPVIMESAYAACDEPVPWQFWGVRCFRTLKGLYSAIEPDERQGTHHNALDDAIHQTEHIFKIRKALRGKNT
jgi:hypothetical protein